jgi:hypothetical protein
MIAFCTHCFDEIGSKDHYCPNCGAGLGVDSRAHDWSAAKKILKSVAHTKGSRP